MASDFLSVNRSAISSAETFMPKKIRVKAQLSLSQCRFRSSLFLR